MAEGLAVGVGFGAIGRTAAATFENARYKCGWIANICWIENGLRKVLHENVNC